MGNRISLLALYILLREKTRIFEIFEEILAHRGALGARDDAQVLVHS